MAKKRLRLQHIALAFIAVLLFIAAGPLRVWLAHGQPLGAHSVTIGNSTASATTDYKINFTGQSTGTVGSIRLQFCSNSSLIGYPCTPPAGFSLSGASLTNQSGMTGFTISPDSTGNVLILTRTPGTSVAGNSSYTLHNVVNPNVVGSFFGRLETFTSVDATGADKDFGGLALSTAENVTISSYVPPYLLFCTGITIQPYDCDTAQGDYVDFGEFSSAKTSTGQTQMLAATNDEGGYTIRATGGTLTSGNNTIPSLINPDVSRTGVSQFGLNLRQNTTPASGHEPQGPGVSTLSSGYSTPDFYKFVPGDVIVDAPGVSDYRLYTADYVVNIAKDQPGGVYVSTITYIGLANF